MNSDDEFTEYEGGNDRDSRKKVSVYCRIYSYLEAKVPRYANIIDDLCLQGLLNVNSGGRGNQAGVTLLIPSDATLGKLEKLVYDTSSDKDIENHNTALEIVKAHVLKNAYDTADSFRVATPVVNKLNKIVVVTIKGDEVKVKDTGATLTKDTNFRTNKPNLQVWKVSGDMPTNGEVFVPSKLTKGGYGGSSYNNRPLYRGACEEPAALIGGGNDGEAIRLTITEEVQRFFTIAMLDVKSNSPNLDIYEAAVVGLAKYVKANNETLYNHIYLRKAVLPEVTFYLWIQPWKTFGRYRIDARTLSDWWNSPNKYYRSGNASVEYKKLDSMATLTNCKVATAEGRREVKEAIDKVRREILRSDEGKSGLFVSMQKVYDTLQKDNRIGSVTGIYPPDFLQTLEPSQLNSEDEFQYIVGNEFIAIRTSSVFDIGSMCSLFQYDERSGVVGTVRKYPGNSYTRERTYIQDSKLAARSATSDFCRLAKFFVRTSFFCYFPQPMDEILENKPVNTRNLFRLDDRTTYIDLAALHACLIDKTCVPTMILP